MRFYYIKYLKRNLLASSVRDISESQRTSHAVKTAERGRSTGRSLTKVLAVSRFKIKGYLNSSRTYSENIFPILSQAWNTCITPKTLGSVVHIFWKRISSLSRFKRINEIVLDG